MSKNNTIDYNNVKIDLIGLREGEKLYEELLVDYKANKTDKNYIYRSNEKKISEREFDLLYRSILSLFKDNDKSKLKKILSDKFINYQSIA